MLMSVDTGLKVTKLPHMQDYTRWRSKLSDDDYEMIEDAINGQIDENDINTAGWMPGHDWAGTVYEPLYEACGKSITQAGMFFGLIVFKILMERKDAVWAFGRFEKDGVPIRSMTYFRTPKDPKDF